MYHLIEHGNRWDPNIAEAMGLTPEAVSSLNYMLYEFHENFDDCFTYQTHREHSLTYLKGLLSDMKRKSLEPIALSLMGEKGVRPLQHFFQKGKWNERLVHRRYLQILSTFLTNENAMVTVDGCGFVKKGKDSVGVKRQYCGTVGKIENCQVGVFLGIHLKQGIRSFRYSIVYARRMVF